MQTKLCASCRQAFQPPPHIPRQRFCSLDACQRERRRKWQQTKRNEDPDYRDNQARAQKAWLARQPDYWRRYRESHPDYVARNRNQQAERNNRQRVPSVAKMDVSLPLAPITSGIYRLSRHLPGIAKMDEWIVQLTMLPNQTVIFVSDCKEST